MEPFCFYNQHKFPILLRAHSSFVKFTRFIEKIQKNDSITYQTNLYFSHEHWWFL